MAAGDRYWVWTATPVDFYERSATPASVWGSGMENERTPTSRGANTNNDSDDS